MNERRVIQRALDNDEAAILAKTAVQPGPVAKLAASCNTQGNNLLGFVLGMSYDEATIVTCDAWKRKCGGLPKNSFVIIRLSPTAAQLAPDEMPKPSLILARVIDTAPTPLDNELQQTIFSIHKVQTTVCQ